MKIICSYNNVYKFSAKRTVLQTTLTLFIFGIIFLATREKNLNDIFYNVFGLSLILIIVHLINYIAFMMQTSWVQSSLNSHTVEIISDSSYYYIKVRNQFPIYKFYKIYFLFICVTSRGLLIRYPFSLFYRYNFFPFESKIS